MEIDTPEDFAGGRIAARSSASCREPGTAWTALLRVRVRVLAKTAGLVARKTARSTRVRRLEDRMSGVTGKL
jgi:hypothetical protein